MTSSFLQSELTSLITDSKRKFGDVRSAAEKSLGDLKGITVTSETQLAADLARKTAFIDPFLLACQTKNAKLATSATNCLQRLIASRAVGPERLGEILDALKDVVSASYDVQLKILQTLPALLQLYSSQIHGSLLASTLGICAVLQGSKTPLISSSAGATLWQLITSVFEHASRDQANDQEISNGEAEGSTAADDAGRLFEDLCSVLNQTEATFIRIDGLSTFYLVETLHKVIDDNAAYIRSRPYLVEACRKQLLPAITSLLETAEDASSSVLVLQLCMLLLQKLSPMIFSDMEPIFTLILKFADREYPFWRRALALEFFSRLFANFGLVARLFDEFKGQKNNVVVTTLATYVRIASEDPVLIGLGRQSTMPAQHKGDLREDDMAAIEAQGLGGLASVGSADVTATGISLEDSTLETALLDTTDATKIGSIPRTYLYTLILESISSLCEGLSKFIMPLSVSARGQDEDVEVEEGGIRRSQSVTRAQRNGGQKNKYQRLMNPLKIEDLPQLPQVQACSEMVEHCWPAVLAMCSTFLNAAVDSHFYHVLIRSIQKLAQVSGTLDLSTPRDALLTTLAKGSIPANATSFIQLMPPATRGNDQQEPKTPIKSPPADKQSFDSPRQPLNVRHLLCLRALLNLGIALGPTLGQESWFIIIETLQQAEALIGIGSAGRTQDGQDGQTITTEIVAVNTAARKMLESTKSYTDDAFGIVVTAIFRLMGEGQNDSLSKADGVLSPAPVASPGGLTSPVVAKHGHKVSRSVSGIWMKTKALDMEVGFAFTKLRDLARLNLHRFATLESSTVIWELVTTRLLKASQSRELSASLRLQAASIVDLIATETLKLIKADEMDEVELDQLQSLCLNALVDQVVDVSATSPSEHSAEVTKRVFEALEDILGHSGEALQKGWTIVFRILQQSFSETGDGNSETLAASTPVAFRCVQLICTDFVELLEFEALRLLLSLLYLFGSQQHDTNMALTTTGLLRNIATLLQRRSDTLDVSEDDLNQEDGKAENPVQLWCSALNELAKMCSDARKDVRDASIRILLQTIDAASSQLTPSAWNVLLDGIPFTILQDYQSALNQEGVDRAEITSSSSHLTEGLTNMIVENMAAIVKDKKFSDTWSRLMDIYNVTLEGGQIPTFPLVHNCISRLLKATEEIDMERSSLIESVLMLWAWHPVPEQQSDEVSNQAALTAYLRVFTQAHSTCAEAVERFSHHRRSVSEYATTAIRKSLMTAVHPPYTNDIRTITSEQHAAVKCLEIVKILFTNELDNFCGFILELIQDMLDIEKGSVKQRDRRTPSKKSQKPTYIAVSSHLIDLLRIVAEETQGRDDYASIVQLPYALDMLSAIIKTKYTSIPTNALAPIWRNATTTAVVLLEGSNAFFAPSTEDLADIAQTIIATVAAILGSGDLATQLSSPSSPSQDTVSADEAFDSAHFTRFHHAAIRLISSSELSSITRRQYILALFHASLLYAPWHGDLPTASKRDQTSDNDQTLVPLLTHPLHNLTTPRAPTIHVPVFHPRQAIAYTALDALFGLLSRHQNSHYNPLLAQEATPYLLLRIALPLKSFLADQKLRGWTPLDVVRRGELLGILQRPLDLRVDDRVFGRGVACAKAGFAHEPDDDDDTASAAGSTIRQQNGGGSGDGKAHLRILYSLILQVQKEWRESVRLPGGRGWMDVEGGEGKGVEGLLGQWVEGVGEGSGALMML